MHSLDTTPHNALTWSRVPR